jgi:hypothetical protein
MQRLNCDRLGLSAAAVGLMAILAGAVAFAGPAPAEQSVENVSFTDEGRSLSIAAEALGLDSERDAYVTLTATAEIELACINPRGNEPWWRQPDDLVIELSGANNYSKNAIESGRLELDLRTEQVELALPGAPHCPPCRRGREWTEQVKAVRFTGATLIVRQGDEQLALECSFAAPSQNGEIPNSELDCEISAADAA